MKITANVQNLPTTIDRYLAKNDGVLWITATPFRGELWYFGLWYTEAEAMKQAQIEDKVVLKMEA